MAKGRFSFEIKDRGVQRGLARRRTALRRPLVRAMTAAGEDLRTTSQGKAPRRDSILVNSAFARTEERRDEIVSTVGYSASYAATIHENPRAGKTGGVSPSGQRYKKWAKVGGYKFLERALDELRGELLQTLRDAVQEGLR